MSGAIVAYSGFTLMSFHFIAVSFRLVPVYFGTILVHSVSFRRHSASFRYIPVYSVPFHSVPVFSNAPTVNLTRVDMILSVNCCQITITLLVSV